MPTPRPRINRKKEGRKKRPELKIKQETIEKGQVKCRALIQRMGGLGGGVNSAYDPLVNGKGRHLSESTRASYRGLWKEMKKFFYLIGDYQSAMLCDREVCPLEPLPFRPESWAMYLEYRCGEVGQPVLNPLNKHSTEPMQTVEKTPLLCIGGWGSPDSLFKVHAAVKFLHEIAYTSSCGGAYKTDCQACANKNSRCLFLQDIRGKSVWEKLESNFEYSLFIENSRGYFASCARHANNPTLICSGSILQDPCSKANYLCWLRMKQKSHDKKGCGQLYPSELRKLREHLLIDASPQALQMWVMLLVGIRLFLRIDELITLDVDQFEDSYFPLGKVKCENKVPDNQAGELISCQYVSSTRVTSIACEIFGKTDHKPIRLTLMQDEEYPEFDELRHLLWYLRMFNIKSGYIFPPVWMLEEQWRTDCIEPLCSTEHIQYEDFLTYFKHLCYKILKRLENVFIIGTHTMRKTAYLFAIWGFYFSCNYGARSHTTTQVIPCKYGD